MAESDFVYDNTGRKFLKCAQLQDEGMFGPLSESSEAAKKAADMPVDAQADASIAQAKQSARPTVKLYDK